MCIDTATAGWAVSKSSTGKARLPRQKNIGGNERSASHEKIKGKLYLSVAAIVFTGYLAIAPLQLSAQQTPPAVAIDNDDIGGVVTGANGPEAGIWVIAETNDLPTRFARMVVTDDQGRYVVPDLPKARYKLWVRGYGLVDLPKIDGEPGKIVNHRAVPAPNAAEAAKYYPGIYWYSMLKICMRASSAARAIFPRSSSSATGST